MEIKKIFDKKIVVDYAHHPTEIKSVYEFLRTFKKRITLIFQPHTFSRTKEFQKEFIKILSKFDKVVLFKTYSAREQSTEGLSAFELSKCIKDSIYFDRVKQVKTFIKKQPKDELVVIMGAGDLPELLGLY